jgi:hypothetical protein
MEEKKAMSVAAKVLRALKPSSLQAHMARVHGAEGEGAAATSPAPGVLLLRGMGPLRQRCGGSRVMGYPPQQGAAVPTSGARGVSLYSINTNVSQRASSTLSSIHTRYVTQEINGLLA